MVYKIRTSVPCPRSETEQSDRIQSRLAAKMGLVVPFSLSAMSSKGGDLSDEIALLKDCLRPTQPAPRGRWLLGVPTPLGMEDTKAVEEGRQAGRPPRAHWSRCPVHSEIGPGYLLPPRSQETNFDWHGRYKVPRSCATHCVSQHVSTRGLGEPEPWWGCLESG